MRKMEENDLPCWPSKGNRRKLDELWLKKLECDGTSAFLTETPAEAPPELYKALEEFNGRMFWECHETLEDIWRNTPYPLRFFYHAIIKVAVGFHHLYRHNRHGARVKLSDGVRLLRLFPPSFLGVRTDLLCRDASTWLAWVESVGPIEWMELEGRYPHLAFEWEGRAPKRSLTPVFKFRP